jgi:hypothetical protein
MLRAKKLKLSQINFLSFSLHHLISRKIGFCLMYF